MTPLFMGSNPVIPANFIQRKDVFALSYTKLTVKQEAFCLHYAKTGNATESYKQAGYKITSDEVTATNASRLLKNDKVQARLQELADEVHNDAIADIKEMQEMLTSMLRGEVEEEIVVVVGQGDGFSKPKKINKQISATDRIKALDKLAKMMGAYKDKVELSGTATVQFVGESELED